MRLVKFQYYEPSWDMDNMVELENVALFVGQNAMGRLLMQVRANYIENGRQRYKLLPPDVVGFLLFGYPIGTVYGQEYYNDEWL